jgi:predicted TIM-barrel fold metal-dependent hydrolase
MLAMSKPPAGGPAVDTHFHVFSLDAAATGGSRYRPAYAATLDDWWRVCGDCGVRRGVVVQPSFFGSDNRELLAALDAGRGALRGVAVLDADFPPERLPALDRAGVRAVRWNLVGRGEGDMPRADRWRDLLAAAHELGWHLELHTDSGRLPDALERVPDVPIPVVVDHFGKLPARASEWPATLSAAERALRERDVYVKLSGPYRNPGVDLGAAARAWRALVGGERLLWGSDWPWTNHEAGRDYRRLADAPSKWLGDTGATASMDRAAQRLFGWPQADPA